MKALVTMAGNVLAFGLTYLLGHAVAVWDKAWHR